MSLNAEKSRFRALDNWFLSPQGIHISDAFSSELVHLNGILYGETLLQLGNCGDNLWLRSLHYNHKWCATPYSHPSSSLISSFTQLPLDRHSVNCVIAPLTMSGFSRHKNPVDEIDRVLKPMGYAVFFGTNPLSLWGMLIRSKRYSCFGPFPGQSMSVFFIKHAMLHRGYIQCSLSVFYYIPPVSTKKALRKLEILNELGKMISPCPAGFYCLVVQKQEEIHPDVVLNAVDEKQWKKNAALQPT